MTITLDKSKGSCVGNDNQDLSYVVRLMLLHVLNLVKQTRFLVYFASFFRSNINTSDLKGIFIRVCGFGKYALVLGASVGHVVSAVGLAIQNVSICNPEVPSPTMTIRWINLQVCSSSTPGPRL